MANNFTVPDCGRLACPIPFPDGSVGAFYNVAIADTGSVKWVNEYGEDKYEMEYDDPDTDAKLKRRALYWNKYLPNEEGDKKLRIVPFIEDGYVEAWAVYEVICPQICQMTGTQGFNLTFWSNLDEGVTTATDYDSTELFKISEKTMAGETLSAVTHKALFTATVRFELLKQIGGGVNDSNCILTPVISGIRALYVDSKPIADYITKAEYKGMFRTYCEYEGEGEEREPHIFIDDGFGDSSGSSTGAGICFINQFKFNVDSYDFYPENGMNYVFLYSSGISVDGDDIKPSPPEWYIDTTFPDIENEECYILIARIKYDSTDQSCIVSQENYGVAQGFIFAECEDDPGEDDDGE